MVRDQARSFGQADGLDADAGEDLLVRVRVEQFAAEDGGFLDVAHFLED